MATLFVDKIDPQSGTSLEIGSSGDTITIPSGVTQTGVGGTNTPAFEVRQTSGQSVSSGSFTKMTWNVENYDTNNAFASDKFTVPSGQDGKYYFQVTTELSGIDDGEFVNIMIYKNGSSAAGATARWYSPGTNLELRARTQVILNLAVGDYIEAKLYQNSGDAQNASADESSFTGYKLIGI